MQVHANQDTLQLHKVPPHFKSQLLIFVLHIHLTLWGFFNYLKFLHAEKAETA